MLAAISQLRTVRSCVCCTLAASKRFHYELRVVPTCKHVPQSAGSLQPGFKDRNLHAWVRRTRCYSTLDEAALAKAVAGTADEESEHTPLSPGLYLVGTPIGNLEDLSVRALKILQTATVILAEDTRHSRKLLNHYGIQGHLHSFHQHNEHSKQARVLQQLSQGASVAIISDAGMPLISDPGSGLVAAAAAAGHRVIPIAGPSAFLLALVASGLSSTRFTFVGFLPDKAKRRQQQLQDLADLMQTLIFYVPPHDLLAVLRDAANILGQDRHCVIARELTKVHEEFVRCSLEEAVSKYSQTAPKGEVTLVIEGATQLAAEVTAEELRHQVAALIASGHSTSSAAKLASKQLGVPRRQAYAAALELQGATGE